MEIEILGTAGVVEKLKPLSPDGKVKDADPARVLALDLSAAKIVTVVLDSLNKIRELAKQIVDALSIGENTGDATIEITGPKGTVSIVLTRVSEELIADALEKVVYERDT